MNMHTSYTHSGPWLTSSNLLVVCYLLYAHLALSILLGLLFTSELCILGLDNAFSVKLLLMAPL